MYLKLTNGVPSSYSIDQLRRDNPNTSFPNVISDEMLASYGVYPYTVPTAPSVDGKTQVAVRGDFTQDAQGNWTRSWLIEQLPQENAERNVRAYRDDLLAKSDWRVIKSYERSENLPAAWELYRQALRDITSQEGFPFNVTWPTEPAQE